MLRLVEDLPSRAHERLEIVGWDEETRLAARESNPHSPDVGGDDWPAQRSCAGYDLPRETGIDGLWCVGDAVKQYGNGGTQACAETAKIVTDAILAQRPRVPQAGR